MSAVAEPDRRLLWLVLAATLTGGMLRILWPELRPIHHDEAVNWFVAGRVLRSGVYVYDAANYHGPLPFYLAALGRWLGGDHLAALRMPTAVIGTAMIPLTLLLRGILGRAGTAGAAWALALSPSLVFYARDAIHETWLAAFTLAAVASGVCWWQADGSKRSAWALAFGTSIGAMVATKETAILTIVGWIAGLTAAASVAVPRDGENPHLRDLSHSLGHAMIAMSVVVLVLFSGFGRAPEGLIGLVSTLGIWTARGLEGGGHAKPWFTFLEWLWRAEGPWLLLAVAGALACVRRRDATGVGLAVWTVTVLAAYSAIPYKTPWCLLQITLPVTLLAGQALGWLATGGRERRLLLVVAMAAVLTMTIRSSFLRFDDPREPLVYVQTHREMKQAVAAMSAVLDAIPDPKLRNFFDRRYPMNWYLRRRGVELEPLDPPPDRVDGDVLISSRAQAATLAEQLLKPYRHRSFRFREGMFIEVWIDEKHERLLPDAERWTLLQPLPERFEPPPLPDRTAPGWVVRYHTGKLLTESPFLVETRAVPDLAWNDDYEKPRWAPQTLVWEAWVHVDAPGQHRFRLRSDDGSRLWIDGLSVVDGRGSQGPRSAEGSANLAAGWHHARLVWRDNGGPAWLMLTWSEPGGELGPWPADRTVHESARPAG